MIFWLLLFILIVLISFILAYQSMRDFQEKLPAKIEHGLFLVRNLKGLTPSLLDRLHEMALSSDYIISMERLFKGDKKALVIFGPKSILSEFKELNLLELEDYVSGKQTMAAVWEVNTKDPLTIHLDIPKLQQIVLSGSEQVWWQIVLMANKGSLVPHLKEGDLLSLKILSKLGLSTLSENYLLSLQKILSVNPELRKIVEDKNRQKVFRAEIRIVVLSQDVGRRKALSEEMQKMMAPKLIKIPQPLTSMQMLELYKDRSLSGDIMLMFTSEEVLQILGIES